MQNTDVLQNNAGLATFMDLQQREEKSTTTTIVWRDLSSLLLGKLGTTH